MQKIKKILKEMENIIEGSAAGVEYDADPADECPENSEAYMAGLLWQKIQIIKSLLSKI